jgi:hypothetical protein
VCATFTGTQKMRAIPEGCAPTPYWYSLCWFSRFVDQEKAPARTFSVNPEATHGAGSYGWVAKTAVRLARVFGVCSPPPGDQHCVDQQMVEADQQMVEATCAESPQNASDREPEVDVEVSRGAARAAEQAALRDALERVLDKLCEGERARRAAVRPPGSGALA